MTLDSICRRVALKFTFWSTNLKVIPKTLPTPQMKSYNIILYDLQVYWRQLDHSIYCNILHNIVKISTRWDGSCGGIQGLWEENDFPQTIVVNMGMWCSWSKAPRGRVTKWLCLIILLEAHGQHHVFLFGFVIQHLCY